MPTYQAIIQDTQTRASQFKKRLGKLSYHRYRGKAVAASGDVYTEIVDWRSNGTAENSRPDLKTTKYPSLR